MLFINIQFEQSIDLCKQHKCLRKSPRMNVYHWRSTQIHRNMCYVFICCRQITFPYMGILFALADLVIRTLKWRNFFLKTPFERYEIMTNLNTNTVFRLLVWYPWKNSQQYRMSVACSSSLSADEHSIKANMRACWAKLSVIHSFLCVSFIHSIDLLLLVSSRFLLVFASSGSFFCAMIFPNASLYQPIE